VDAVDAQRRFNLESAAFLFHITVKTLRIIGSLQAACSDPRSGFWLASSS